MTNQEINQGIGSSRREFLLGAGGAALLLGAGRLPGYRSGGRPASSGEFGDITMWWQTYAGEWLNKTADWADQFNSLDMGHVESVVVPWNTALQKWDLAMSNCTNPDVADVFFLQSRIVAGQGDGCGPLDITAEVEAGEFGEWERFIPITRSESAYQDRIYGIPWRVDIRALVYNSTLWQPVTTLEEFEAQAEEVVGANDLEAAAFLFGGPYQRLAAIGAMWDVSFLTPDFTQSALDDERWVEACQWTQDMIDRKVIHGVLARELEPDPFQPFVTGRVALYFGGNADLPSYIAADLPELADSVGVAAPPVGPAGESRGLAVSAQLSIFENTQSRDTAFEWLKYLTSSDTAQDIVAAAGVASPDTDVQATVTDPISQAFYEVGRTATILDSPVPQLAQLTARPEGPFTRLAVDVFLGNDVGDALATAHEATQAILGV